MIRRAICSRWQHQLSPRLLSPIMQRNQFYHHGFPSPQNQISQLGKHSFFQGFAVSATGWKRQLPLTGESTSGRRGLSSSRRRSSPRRRSRCRSSSRNRKHDDHDDSDHGDKKLDRRSRRKKKGGGGGRNHISSLNHHVTKSQMAATEQSRLKKKADHAAALERIECLAAVWTQPTTPASRHPMVNEAWSRMTKRPLSTLQTKTKSAATADA